MQQSMIIYHGSQQIVEVPQFGIGKEHNDYGRGFYCTENKELAKEWACQIKNDGYSNKYQLSLEGLNVMRLTGDVMIGYRADDSYFSFAEDFVNNTISLRDLNMAMHLGMLGEQVVLLSRRSFDRVKFISYEVADYREYYYKRAERDQDARTAYASHKKDLQQLMDDIFVLDIMREGMGNDDARLQSALFE